MKSPYTVLAVSVDSDDQQIKKSYLEAVRNNSPDQKPDEFQKIRQAYEQIATRKDRLRYELFDTSTPDIVEIAELVFEESSDSSITESDFCKVLDNVLSRNVPELE